MIIYSGVQNNYALKLISNCEHVVIAGIINSTILYIWCCKNCLFFTVRMYTEWCVYMLLPGCTDRLNWPHYTCQVTSSMQRPAWAYDCWIIHFFIEIFPFTWMEIIYYSLHDILIGHDVWNNLLHIIIIYFVRGQVIFHDLSNLQKCIDLKVGSCETYIYCISTRRLWNGYVVDYWQFYLNLSNRGWSTLHRENTPTGE